MTAAMEIRVDDSCGMMDGSIVSIRFGSTRRQAPLETVRQHPLKFPMSPEACCEPLKIDVLQPVATARLVLQPHEASYHMDLDTKGASPMSIDMSIAGATGIDKSSGDRGSPSPPPLKYQDAAASAREYLEMHGLLRYVQALLHAVIQVRPKDPYQFMMQQLGAAKPNAESRPLTPTPPPYPKEGRSSRSKQHVVAPTNLDPALEAVVSQATGGVLGISPPPVSPTPEPGVTRSEVAPKEVAAAPAPQAQQAKQIAATKVNFTFENLDYDKVMADSKLTEMLKLQTGEALANSLKVPASSVDIQLSKGSVVVNAHVFCTNTDAAEMMKKQIDANGDSLMQSVEQCVTQIPAITGAVADGKAGLGVGGLQTTVTEITREAGEPSVEDVRKKMRQKLEESCDTGALSQALGKAKAGEPSVEDVRKKMRQKLEESCDTGALSQALAKGKAPVAVEQTARELPADLVAPSAQEAPPLTAEAAPEQTARLSAVAPAAGQTPAVEAPAEAPAAKETPASAEEPATSKAPDAPKETEASAAAQTSATDIEEPPPPPPKPEAPPPPPEEAAPPLPLQASDAGIDVHDAAQVEDVRLKMKSMLETACQNGTLTRALESVTAVLAKEEQAAQASAQSSSPAPPEVEAVREKLVKILEESCESGLLAEALQKVVKEAKPTLDAVDENKEKKGDAVAASATSGEAKATSGAADEVLEMRERLRTLLETTCESGELEKALKTALKDTPPAKAAEEKAAEKEALPAEADAMRQKMRDLLENACESGELEKALKAIQPTQGLSEKPEPSADKIAEVQSKIRNLLETGAESGNLEKALQQASREKLRIALRSLLETSCESGALEQALQAAQLPQAKAPAEATAKTEPKAEEVKAAPAPEAKAEVAKAEAAPESNDKAQEAKAEPAPETKAEPVKPEPAVEAKAEPPTEAKAQEAKVKNVEEMRVNLRSLLENTCESGDLEKALQVARAQQLKAKLRADLEKSFESGALERAVAKHSQAAAQQSAKPAEATEQKPADAPAPAEPAAARGPDSYTPEELRLRMRALLETATESGDLAKALEKVGSSKEQKAAADVPMDTEQMRVNMRNMLEEACDSGTLQTALEAVIGEPKQEASAPAPEAAASASAQPSSEEDLKLKMRSLLERSAESGELAAALQKVVPLKPATDEAPKAAAEDKMNASVGEASLVGEECPEETGGADLDGLKEKMRAMLEQACDSGQLGTALGAVKTSREEAAKASEEGKPEAPKAEASQAPAEAPKEEKPEAPKAEARELPAPEAPKAGAPEAPKAEVRQEPKEEVPKATPSTSLLDSQEQIRELQSVVMGMKEDNMSLHQQVDQLEAAMKDLKSENASLVETLRSKRPSSASQRPA